MVYWTLLLISCITSCGGGQSVESAPAADMSVRVRGNLARALYQRMREDEAYAQEDPSRWYSVKEEVLADAVRTIFVQCHHDDDACAFINRSREKSDWLFTQMYHSLARSILSWFMSPTSINGLLKRGTMFVFSTSQFRDLLGVDGHWRATNLLDLGAGDGEVTRVMAAMFDHVFTTEMSTPMTWRLQEKGYSNLAIDAWQKDGDYDVISCLNVIDRCAQPMTLLRDIRRSLKPVTGRAIVAVVLPYKPYVEFDSKDHVPTQRLGISGSTFEQQVNTVVSEVLEPAGFRVTAFTRLPYLCEGDLEHSFYMLDDAVFVLEPA